MSTFVGSAENSSCRSEQSWPLHAGVLACLRSTMIACVSGGRESRKSISERPFDTTVYSSLSMKPAHLYPCSKTQHKLGRSVGQDTTSVQAWEGATTLFSHSHHTWLPCSILKSTLGGKFSGQHLCNRTNKNHAATLTELGSEVRLSAVMSCCPL